MPVWQSDDSGAVTVHGDPYGRAVELDRRTLSQLIMNAALLMTADGVPATIPCQLDDDNPVIPLAIEIDDDVAPATLLSWSEQDYGYRPALCNAALVRLEMAGGP